jgi:ABC-type transport system involved in multi-copper enzyme maturation permease subunit
MHAFKAELRKILTVRSTYVWLFASFAISVLLVGFWIYGYKDVEHAGQNADAMLKAVMNGIGIVGVFMSFPLILLIGHEYRYNTILYSLTNTRQRFSVFFSKLAVGMLLALVTAAVMAVLTAVAFTIGQSFRDGSMLDQVLLTAKTVWLSLAYIIGNVAFAFVIAIIARSMIAAIAVFLLLPSMIEQLFTLLLKDGIRFLPFTALNNLLPSGNTSSEYYPMSLLIVSCYAVGFGILAAVLFKRRDAN